MLLQQVAHLVVRLLGLVARLGQLGLGGVGGGVDLRLFHHAFDLVLVETGRTLDLDLLFFAGGLVARFDFKNAIGVDLERHFDLRRAAWRTAECHQESNLPEQPVVRAPFCVRPAKTLMIDRRLVVGCG